MNPKKFESKKRLIDYSLFVFITSTILIMRFALWMSEKSIWGDEWFTIEYAQKTISRWSDFFIPNHPPGHQLLLSLWVKWFGRSELALRGLSHLMNILMVIGSYGAAKEMFNRKVAVLTAAFVGICPYFLHLSNEIRSYGTFAFFSTFTIYFFFKARNNLSRNIWKLAYILFAALTIYTQYYGWFLLFGISAYIIFKLVTNWEKEKKWIGIQGVIFLICAPSLKWMVSESLFEEKIFVQTKLAPYRGIFDMIKKVFGIYWHFICGPIYSMLPVQRVIELAKSSFPFWMSLFLTVTFLGLFLKGLIDLFRNDKPLAIFLATAIIFPVVFLIVVYPIRLDSRYLCWAVAPFFSLIAFAILSIRNGLLRKLIVGWFFIYATIANIYIILIPTDPKHKEDYRAMLQYAIENSGKNDAVVGVGPQTTYYLSSIGIKPRGAYYHSMPEALQHMQSPEFEHLWTMLYIDMKPEVTERVLTEIDSFFLPFSYVRTGPLMRFGGADALTAIQLYEKNHQKRKLG